MLEVLENPNHFKPLSNLLKKYRRAHVGSFVIAFRIIEDEKKVKFVAYEHHDVIYERSFTE
jgi:mRNA-degrading endonuclease RelE of RelBE toxin-antitoxin system